jgi:hypothetical protein
LSTDSYVSFRSVLHVEQRYCDRMLLICSVKILTTKPYGGENKVRYST